MGHHPVIISPFFHRPHVARQGGDGSWSSSALVFVETQRDGEMTQKWVKHGGFDGDFMGFYYGFNGI